MPAIVTSEDAITSTWAGIAYAQLINKATDVSQVFRTPSDFELDLGIKTKTIDGSDNLGQKTEIARYVDENKPQYMLKVGGCNLRLLGLQTNTEIVGITGSSEILLFRKQALVSPTPPIPLNGYGNEIVVDAVAASASAILNGGLTVGLTQQPFATFVPATLLSFAVGANGTFKFSNDLISARAFINIRVPATIDVQSYSENRSGLMESRVVMRRSSGGVTICHVPTLAINPEGAKIGSGMDSTDIKGSVIVTGCQGFTLKDYPSSLTC
jgi:hypothetical protein